ncbi:MAG: tautomerase family protein [Enterococcaceae bacterium]|nr:tautomerase family protein [Enterococcaceae bacterium]
MPLINVDLYESFPEEKLTCLLNTIHQTVVESFLVPERDRYQVVRKHPKNEMMIQDTGLGLVRSEEVIVLTIFSRKRSTERKQHFYQLLAANLKQALQIRPEDLMVSIIENGDADWSFGMGEAQFLTGEL